MRKITAICTYCDDDQLWQTSGLQPAGDTRYVTRGNFSDVRDVPVIFLTPTKGNPSYTYKRLQT